MTAPLDRPARHPRIRRTTVVLGWLLIAGVTAAVTYALLVLGGH